MNIRIELLSDTVFGSGRSIPGAEDMSILHDPYGFPYLSGTNLKGNLREMAENLVSWKSMDPAVIRELFGEADSAGMKGEQDSQIFVSDFMLPAEVRKAVLTEYKVDTVDKMEEFAEEITGLFTELRTFTSVEDGSAKEGSLRVARCLQKGLTFYGNIRCMKEQEPFVKEALSDIKWLGSMRTRGFGMVKIEVIGE